MTEYCTRESCHAVQSRVSQRMCPCLTVYKSWQNIVQESHVTQCRVVSHRECVHVSQCINHGLEYRRESCHTVYESCPTLHRSCLTENVSMSHSVWVMTYIVQESHVTKLCLAEWIWHDLYTVRHGLLLQIWHDLYTVRHGHSARHNSCMCPCLTVYKSCHICRRRRESCHPSLSHVSPRMCPCLTVYKSCYTVHKWSMSHSKSVMSPSNWVMSHISLPGQPAIGDAGWFKVRILKIQLPTKFALIIKWG